MSSSQVKCRGRVQAQNDQESNHFQVKENILILITSCLASLGTILEGDGLSLAIRINH
ncbi:MAG: hypothetical protein AB4058_15045 [Microcystaceae cyanobacterium]